MKPLKRYPSHLRGLRIHALTIIRMKSDPITKSGSHYSIIPMKRP